MPLLNKKPFIRREPPPNLDDNDTVFYSDITNEVFTEYEDYWARLVLCNAMVWTCELTGRPNLTYAEAVESENKARKCLANVPKELRKPMLYITTLTRRGRYADTSDDVFSFVRDRYFVGEEVEAIVRKHWYDCKVLRVIHPTEEEIAAYEAKMAESDEEDDDEKSDDGIEIIEEKSSPQKIDDDIEIVKVVNKKEEKPKEIKKKDEDEDYPPFATFKYEVIEIEPWDNFEPQKHIVTWEQIRRNKGVLTREKCKLFLKQVVQLSPAGFWCLKDKIIKKYGLENTRYSDIFLGNPPKFQETKSKKLPASLGASPNSAKKKEDREEKKKLEKAKKMLKEDKTRLKKEEREKNGEMKKKPGRVALTELEREQKKKLMEEEKEQRKKMLKEMKEGIKAGKREELKQKMEKEKEERKKEKEVKKEQKRLQSEYMKEWRKPRDDLDCDDHKDLPQPIPVQCRIPDNLFSEFMMVLEFVNVFTDLLELKDVYPQGITFDMLEHALVEKEIAGVLNDVFQLLLQAIFTLQEEEDDEVEADTTTEEVMETDTTDITIQEAVRMANVAATWSQQYYGVPLQKVPLDALTLTEVLRLHLLASGATNVANAQWRILNRGGYKSTDDPGLLFKLQEPEVVKSLTSRTIFDVPLVDKLKILNVLIGQILTYASARDIIDDNIEKLKEMKNKLRLDQLAQMRKEREIHAARVQEKRERRQKEVEKRIKEAEKKAAAQAMTGEPDKPVDLDLEEEEEEEEEDDKEDLANREERELKNKEQRRQEFLKKERDLLQQILNTAKGVNIAPLGQDRAYRRYWLFNSLCGLFVEDNETNPGLCRLTPTPYNPESNPELSEALNELFRNQAEKNVVKQLNCEKDEKNASDKENDSSNNSPSKLASKNGGNKSLLQVPNQNHVQNGVDGASSTGADSEEKMDIDAKSAVSGEAAAEVASENSANDDDDDSILGAIARLMEDNVENKEIPDIYGLCTGDMTTCPVHSEREDHHRWYFFHNLEDVHTLIDNLNTRGYREKELKSSLEYYRGNIESSIRACPVYKLDPSQEPELDVVSRKSQRHLTTKKDSDVNLNFPPGTEVDEILQLTLRDMILETEEKIFMGMLGSLRTDNRNAWREAIEKGGFLRDSEIDYGGRRRITQMKVDLGLKIEEESEVDAEDLPDEGTKAAVVKDLAHAILLVGQSVDAKYLTQPLGETEKMRKKRERLEEKLRRKAAEKVSDDEGSDQDSDDEEEDGKKANNDKDISDNALRTPMERWEKSLMASTNLSQLCLHYATLDNSITWSRSALNARCRICRRKADAENMLLCDGCDKGHHIYCLKPKLKSIPSGDWFCDKCKPKEKPKSPRKKNRQIYTAESDEEGEEEHNSSSEEEDQEVENHNTCYECGKSGTLICCDTCPLSFHLDCALLRKVPRGSWSCRQCQSPDVKESQADKKKTKEKDKNKENHKVKESNKENKEKKSGKNNKKESSKKGVPKEKNTNKSSPPADKKRRSDVDSSEQAAKKLRLRENEEENTTPKRTRRSLVDDACELNTPALETILEELLKHSHSWPFVKPVSKKDAPDYYEIVKKPMDFRKIHAKLFDMKYLKDEEFIADVMLVFQNCQQYNMENTDEYKAGKLLSKYFLKRVHDLGLNYQGERKQPAKKKKV
ncbi:bromodomain adjacent to zinc finger domain protein 1A [Palaemon carinicauda]|uniref:bromodomain adjacent to zinc finger domain protein 1A n=1 Tax=Palaemon carinicauda TaxID=392227 RepID=UPI0035B5D5AE